MNNDINIKELDQAAINGDLKVENVDSIIEIYGESDYLCGMKVVLLCDENIESAQSYFEKVKIQPSTYLIYSYGYILHSKQEFESAMSVYESSILNDSKKQNFWVHLSLAYLKETMNYDYDQVMQSIYFAKKISPENPIIIASQAELNVLYGNYVMADSVLSKIPNSYRPSWVFFIKGQSKLKQGDIETAKMFFKKGLENVTSSKEMIDLSVSLIDVHLHENDTEKASLLLEELTSKHPDNVDLLYRAAEVEDKKNNHQASLVFFEKAFEQEVLPNFLNEYILICIRCNDIQTCSSKFYHYKRFINKIDYQSYGYLVDAVEIFLAKKMKNTELQKKLQKKYYSEYFETEIEYLNNLLENEK